MKCFATLACAAALLFSNGAFAQSQGLKNPPKFSDYPAALQGDSPHGLATEPILDSKKAKRYRSVIRSELREPANFAGHYRIAIWGCGTDCRDFAILDKKTGRVYTMPGVNGISGVMGNDDERVEFRADSRLLVISACLSGDCIPDKTRIEPKVGKFHYLWNGRKLQLIRSAPLAIQSS